MKIITISEDEYMMAFKHAVDKYFDYASEAGIETERLLVQGLSFALISTFMMEELFDKSEDEEDINLDIKDTGPKPTEDS